MKIFIWPIQKCKLSNEFVSTIKNIHVYNTTILCNTVIFICVMFTMIFINEENQLRQSTCTMFT